MHPQGVIEAEMEPLGNITSRGTRPRRSPDIFIHHLYFDATDRLRHCIRDARRTGKYDQNQGEASRVWGVVVGSMSFVEECKNQMPGPGLCLTACRLDRVIFRIRALFLSPSPTPAFRIRPSRRRARVSHTKKSCPPTMKGRGGEEKRCCQHVWPRTENPLLDGPAACRSPAGERERPSEDIPFWAGFPG
ncbi:hypothetical protein LZ30DRAFT_207619 [Colletotrichum cereale]|nr:hypothetical protein LZ30DRAFT_207619 [Colletotrichum cereale]